MRMIVTCLRKRSISSTLVTWACGRGFRLDVYERHCCDSLLRVCSESSSYRLPSGSLNFMARKCPNEPSVVCLSFRHLSLLIGPYNRQQQDYKNRVSGIVSSIVKLVCFMWTAQSVEDCGKCKVARRWEDMATQRVRVENSYDSRMRGRRDVKP